jgi:Cu+-exporting ATPase
MESSKFYLLDKFINFTKKAFNIVMVSFVISFLYNVIGLSFAVTGTMSPLIAAVLMPVSSVSVVVFATLSVKLLSKRHL